MTERNISCEFVLDSLRNESFYNVAKFELCTMRNQQFFGMVLLLFYTAFLFYALAFVASRHFCPSISYISTFLNLPETVAGVTVAALGNGAPDLFSTFTAFKNKVHDLAIGELLGISLFNSLFIVGLISIKYPCAVPWRPFTRDTVFLFVTVAFLLLLFVKTYISLTDSILLICIYVLYGIFYLKIVTFVLLGHSFKATTPVLDTPFHESPNSIQVEEDSPTRPLLVSTRQSQMSREQEEQLYSSVAYAMLKLDQQSAPNSPTLQPYDWEGVPEAPVITEMNLTTLGWSIRYCYSFYDWLQSRNFSVFPVVASVLIPTVKGSVNEEAELQVANLSIKYSFALLALYLVSELVFFITCLVLMAINLIILLSPVSQSRKKFSVSCYCFVLAAFWIYLIADSLVDVLLFLGFRFGFKNSFIGVTLFAFANSLGDLVTNLAIADAGFPSMALGASYGSPLLNILLGLGTSSLFSLWHKTEPLLIHSSISLFVTAVATLIGLAFTLWYIQMNEYAVDSRLGYILLSLWIVINILMISIELKS